jgi:hypothetical protein
MRRMLMHAAWHAAALSAALAATGRAQDGTWALTNARIETVTRGVIPRGTIVIRDGLIAAVGADVAAPADAMIVDLAGKTVVPGLIDLTSSLGLPQPAAPGGGAPGGGGAPAAQSQAPAFVGLEPERLVADELRPSAADIKSARDLGITAVLSAPTRGAFRGRSALVPLRDSVTAREIIRTPVALHMGYQGVGGGFGGNRYPGTLLGVMAYERQRFYDAKRQDLLEQRYRANPRGMQRPPNDDGLDAIIPVVKGQLPVFFAASNENEIRRALGIAREFGIPMTIMGATEGFLAIDALRAARRPVIVSVDFPRATDVTGWAYRASQRLPRGDSARADSAGRRLVEGNAAALMQAGIGFALASGGRPADLLPNVRKAIAAGLPRDSALAALTMRPAEIAGVAEQLGSIETGKVANLVVSEGDILGDSAKVRMVFVDGIRYTVDPPPPAAPANGPGGRRGGGRPGAAPAAGESSMMTGTWELTVNAPSGAIAVTAVVTQNGTSFTGTVTSQMGTSPISNGSIDGTHVTWTTLAPINGQNVTMNYSADVTGSRISGTIAAGDFGTFPFTGEKRP